jgi:predicted aspartyl protease
VRIGRHTLSNVTAGVGQGKSLNLLPFSVLDQMGKFTIDPNNNKLVFG